MEKLIDFLLKDNWVEVPLKFKKVICFHKNINNEVEQVLLPLDENYTDYYPVLDRNLRFLCKIYNFENTLELANKFDIKVKVDIEKILKYEQIINAFNLLRLENMEFFHAGDLIIKDKEILNEIDQCSLCGQSNMETIKKIIEIYDKKPKLKYPHAGIILMEEFLEPAMLSLNTFSKRSDIDIEILYNIINGSQKITEEVATKLSIFFENSVQFWLNLNEKE